MRGGIPLNSCIKRKGISLASKCNCCSQPSLMENVDHVIVNSEVAKAVWLDMEHKMQIHSSDSSLKLKLNRWCLAR